MKLYMVTTNELPTSTEDFMDVLGVYSTEEKAKEAAAKYEEKYPFRAAFVEEVSVDVSRIPLE